ncbi:NBR1-Ig-like domain-containing protein [Spirillospora sp. CA-294931]|uniref:NBR1-Ig-like domain-containing protein n=1 Tax=Spirillospora sp. CA-294931 TaxID=3240042 RepID=UPI003D94E692
MRARAETIEEFAAALRELRNSVGNPPFREMSGRSGAISHTTLHEATKGNRLPSWGTTAEFVKACGADPADYRERWERANLAVRSVSPENGAALANTSPTITAERLPAPQPPGESPAAPPSPAANDVPERSGRRRLVAAVLAAAAVGTVILGVAIAKRGSGSDGNGQTSSTRPSKAALSPADCPVRASNPALAQPAHKGDAATFIADVTLPDCTRVGAGKTVTKVWRLKNAGTVPWKGYSLRRLDLPQRADQCQTISDVPINDTPPGQMVDIRADIITPKNPGLCYVRFKMVDASGGVAFPGSRPVNFQIIVQTLAFPAVQTTAGN